MEVRSFYSKDLNEGSTEVKLDKDELRHLGKVLRLAPGTRVRVFNGKGIGAEGVIEAIEYDYALVKIERTRTETRAESPIEIHLTMALLKGDRTDFVVQKATELGAFEIRLFSSKYTVVELAEEKREERLKRWQRIAIEAAKQCGRTRVPKVYYFASLKEALSGADGLKVMLFEKEAAHGLKELLDSHTGEMDVSLLVGPEGGFAEEEVRTAEEASFLCARMGPRRLRAETAAVAALSAVQYAFGDLGSIAKE